MITAAVGKILIYNYSHLTLLNHNVVPQQRIAEWMKNVRQNVSCHCDHMSLENNTRLFALIIWCSWLVFVYLDNIVLLNSFKKLHMLRCHLFCYDQSLFADSCSLYCNGVYIIFHISIVIKAHGNSYPWNVKLVDGLHLISQQHGLFSDSCIER